MKKLKSYVKLLRIKHYIKNLLVFLPLVFSKQFFQVPLLLSALLAFLAFSFMASGIYIVNDIRDVNKDRHHPTKCKRPIASGEVKVGGAVVLAVLMFVVSFGVNFFAAKNSAFSWCMLTIYLVLNVLYSFGLKKIPILDVAILASGFLIRLLYGSAVTGIELSNWFYLTAIAACFYLGFGKRRNEFNIESTEKREVLKRYTYNFLNTNMNMCMTLALVFYALWTLDISASQGNANIIWTVPCLMLVVLKYNHDIDSKYDGDPIEVILKDPILFIMVAAYMLLMFALLYI